MTTWLRHHLMCLVGAFVRLARTPWSTLANIVVIGATTALPVLGLLAVTSTQQLAGKLAADPRMTVFMTRDAGRSDIERVQDTLRNSQGVREIRFVPKEAALERLRAIEGLGESLGVLRSNPLPDAVEATLDRTVPDAGEALAQAVRTLVKVDHVQLDAAWMRRVDRFLWLARTALGVLAALFGLALVAVIFNTVRMQAHLRTDEIEVNRLVGATLGFIRRPYLYTGAALGALGGFAGLGLARLAVRMLEEPIAGFAAEYGSTYRFPFLGWDWAGGVVLASATLGLAGAYVAVSTHLYRSPR